MHKVQIWHVLKLDFAGWNFCCCFGFCFLGLLFRFRYIFGDLFGFGGVLFSSLAALWSFLRFYSLALASLVALSSSPCCIARSLSLSFCFLNSFRFASNNLSALAWAAFCLFQFGSFSLSLSSLRSSHKTGRRAVSIFFTVIRSVNRHANKYSISGNGRPRAKCR